MAKPPIKAEVIGLEGLLRGLDTYERELFRAAEAAFFEEAEETITESKPLVPVDEGYLRGSGHVELPIKIPGGFEVVFGYGGPAGVPGGQDVGYAVYVHENLTARHTVGQAKYLEQPVNRRKPGLSKRLRDKIRRRLRSRM